MLYKFLLYSKVTIIIYICVCVCVRARVRACAHVLSRFSRVWLSVTPWTIAHQASLSMGFPMQEYWSGLPFPTTGDLPDPGIEPTSSASAVGSSPLSHQEHSLSLSLSIYIYIYIYFFFVCLFFGCTTQYMGSSFLTRDPTHVPYIGSSKS